MMHHACSRAETHRWTSQHVAEARVFFMLLGTHGIVAWNTWHCCLKHMALCHEAHKHNVSLELDVASDGWVVFGILHKTTCDHPFANGRSTNDVYGCLRCLWMFMEVSSKLLEVDYD